MDRLGLVVVAAGLVAACSDSVAVDDNAASPAPTTVVSSTTSTASAVDERAELATVGEELVAMAEADQDERSTFGDPDAEPWNDEERTARLIEIVDAYGWPTPELVGVEAASAAWLIAQHSDADPEFQQRALSLLSEVADYPGKNEQLALLTDRVAANTGQPQVYGSQVGCYGDQPIPDPDLVEPVRVDERRAALGLEPLADYLAFGEQFCRDQAQIPADAGCPEIRGATLLLRPDPVILVGEVHGTNESPAFVEALTCIVASYGLAVIVGLEIPEEETDSVQAFLVSDGGPDARRQLLARPFWASEFPDGRQSVAMLGLLDGLREQVAAGAELDVVLLDSSTATDRDAVMAGRLLDAIDGSSDTVAIALTGNVHSSTRRGTSVAPDHEPMGYLLARSAFDRTVIAIDVRYRGGVAWVCGDDGTCGPTPLAGNTTEGEPPDTALATVDLLAEPSAAGFHGTYYVGELSPAEPAAEAG